ncbi:hypothetical protein LINGRAHAP2_LOCUS14438, partial [Linum grandiflorum]
IDEDSAHPFFPLESFNIATMPVMRAIAQPRTSSLGFHICMYLSGCCIQGENTALHFSVASYRISFICQLCLDNILQCCHSKITNLYVFCFFVLGCDNHNKNSFLRCSWFTSLPEEYVLLSEPQENVLLTGLHSVVFIVEVRPAEPANMVRTQFIATNIWDPVAAFY